MGFDLSNTAARSGTPSGPDKSLSDVLDRHTVVGDLWAAEDGKVRCLACGHRCLIRPGARGVCKVRYNDAGRLRVPFGYVAGAQCDPVEKKPFYHVFPGSNALTFGMLGCDFHCSYCQNWITSQALRDPAVGSAAHYMRPVSPRDLVRAAERSGARLVVSSYNEPLITAEWAAAVFKEAGKAGLACAFVSNGNATPEALGYIGPHLIAYKVDLKSFDDKRYRSLGGTLKHVTGTIEMVHRSGLWLEVVTLLVPTFNDSEGELRAMAKFLASVSRDIPWHVTAFHPDYKLSSPPATTTQQLLRAAEIGTEEGLRFVYAGNAPGRVGDWENTFCPGCRELLVERLGYLVRSNKLGANGCCPACGTRVPGIWADTPRA
jgi:pyruvate formate lyase activating enzyme